MSVLPTHVRMKDCVKIWRVGSSAPALKAFPVTAVRLMLMIATAPPVWMEEHVWTLSMISGQWRGINCKCIHLDNALIQWVLIVICCYIRCECVSGYSGRLCHVDLDDCEPNLCLNGATCVDGMATFTCRCPPGFNGTRCETGIDGIAAESEKKVLIM